MLTALPNRMSTWIKLKFRSQACQSVSGSVFRFKLYCRSNRPEGRLPFHAIVRSSSSPSSIPLQLTPFQPHSTRHAIASLDIGWSNTLLAHSQGKPTLLYSRHYHPLSSRPPPLSSWHNKTHHRPTVLSFADDSSGRSRRRRVAVHFSSNLSCRSGFHPPPKPELPGGSAGRSISRRFGSSV